MKRNMLIIFLIFFYCYESSISAKNLAEIKGLYNTVILPLNDNVKSNYFGKATIEEESGIPAQEIDSIYNNIIINMISNQFSSNIIRTDNSSLIDSLVNEIEITGEDENVFSNLNKISIERYKSFMSSYNADYVIIINRHYLKWQDTPLRTLFHIISYSVFDSSKTEISRGSQFFTSMDLLDEQQLKKKCKKTTGKIASNVSDAITASLAD